jgi:hypothetical protein
VAKVFDSEGVALVNLLRDSSDGLDEMRERTQDLGIVLNESLVRDDEHARMELDTLSQIISANLTRAALNAELIALVCPIVLRSVHLSANIEV